MSDRFKWLAPVIVIAASLLLPLGAYTAAYFGLGKKGMVGDGVTVIRVYESKPLSVIFAPAAAMESCVTGCHVIATCYDEP
jgi:hypothetical protein